MGALVLAYVVASALYGGYARADDYLTRSWTARWLTSYGIGSRTVFARAGQVVSLEYDVTVREGAFWAYLRKQRPGMRGDYRTFVQTGRDAKGESALPIYDTGLYRVILGGTTNGSGRGYDVTYRAHWRVR